MKQKDIDNLKELVSQMSEDETEIRNILRPILGDKVDGDSLEVPCIADLVIEAIDMLRGGK